jgi:hypothetical protein
MKGPTSITPARLAALEGRRVCLALNDGSRIDGCQLISAGRGQQTAWVFCNGTDSFVPLCRITDAWEDL